MKDYNCGTLLTVTFPGPDYHCIDGSPAMGACSSKNGNHDCLGTSQHLKCCVNSVVKEPYKDGVCCLESVSCGVGRTAGLSQTASGSGLIQRVIGGASSLPVVSDLRGGVPDLRFGASDLRGGVSDVRVGDTAMIGSALTAGVPPSGRVFTRETVSVIEPMGGGTRSVFRQSGVVAGTVIDSMGRAVGGSPGMMIGTSVFGDSTRGKLINFKDCLNILNQNHHGCISVQKLSDVFSFSLLIDNVRYREIYIL